MMSMKSNIIIEYMNGLIIGFIFGVVSVPLAILGLGIRFLKFCSNQ